MTNLLEMKNNYTVDRNSYFKQYAWAMENYDLRAVFMAFLEKERSITDESIKENLYQNFIKNNESNIVTDLQLDVLNYVLKLENGVYKTNDVIFECDDSDDDGSISILEPGFYLFELYGASGTCSDKNKNFLIPTGENTTFSDDKGLIKLYVSKELRFFLEIQDKFTYTRVKGNVELNQDYVFLFSDEIKSGFASPSNDPDFTVGSSQSKFYDFFKFQSNPLEKEFFYLKSVLNKYSLFVDDIHNGKKGYLTYNSFVYDNANNCKYKYYKDIIDYNIKTGTLKEFEFSRFLTIEDGFFNENYLHGGDGGYCSVIIYIDKEQKVSYHVGSYATESDTSVKLVTSGLDIYAECGCKSTKNKYSKTQRASSSVKGLKDIVLSNSFKDVSSKKTETGKFNFHIGENFDYKDYKSGCGRAYAAFDGQGAEFCTFGGGRLGSGIRLNNFNTAYYQKPENGKIKITYLGSLYSKYVLFDDISKNDTSNIECLTHIVKTNGQSRLPLGCNVNFKFFTSQYDGGIFIDNSCIDDKNISDKDRLLNYISFQLKSDFEKDVQFSYSFKSKHKYIDFSVDEDNFVLENTNDFYDKVLGYDSNGDDSFSLDLKFLYSKSYITSLLYAYNKFNECTYNDKSSYNAYLQSFDENSYKSSYIFSNFKCIKIINIFESIIAISFNYESTRVSLPAINDSYGNTVYYAENGYIEKIKYTLTDETDDLKYYTYNNKFIIPVGSSIVIKLFYNTGRVILDESLSTYNGSFDVLDKNVDLSNEYHPYKYFNPSFEENYQYIKFTPASSQEVKFVIKKYAFNLSVLPDIYGQLNVSCLENKMSFEPGEEVNLSFPLKNYIRVSHLLNYAYEDYTDKQSDKIMYKVTEKLHKFESFFQVGHNTDLNLCDDKIAALLNREGCYGIESNQDGVFCLSQREINCRIDKNDIYKSFDYDEQIRNGKLSSIICASYKPITEELITIRFYFKENDISIRLTADYNPCEKIQVVENGDSSIIDIFKNYSFVLFGCGGPTGNGQSGGNAKSSTEDAHFGGNGGDGYHGGNGGNGGNTKNIAKPTPNKWKNFLLVGVNINGYYSGEGGLAGRGFIECGSHGTNGRNVIADACLGQVNESNLDLRDEYCTKCLYYASFPRSIKINIHCSSNSTKSNMKVYLYSGRQGFSFVSTAPIETDGKGGGSGLASFLYAYDDKTAIDYIGNSGKYYIFNNNRLDKKENLKSLIFEGGVSGLSRIQDSHTSHRPITVWTFPTGGFQEQKHDRSTNTTIKFFTKEDIKANGNISTMYKFHESLFEEVDSNERLSANCYTHTNGKDANEFIINLNQQSIFKECLSDNIKDGLIFTNDVYALYANEISDDKGGKSIEKIMYDYPIRGNSYFSYETGILGIIPTSWTGKTTDDTMSYKSFISGETYEKLIEGSSEEKLF